MQMLKIDNPAIVMWIDREDGNKPKCMINAQADLDTPAHFGLLIADLVRHVASAFGCPDDAVWEWIDKERKHPTTTTITAITN